MLSAIGGPGVGGGPAVLNHASHSSSTGRPSSSPRGSHRCCSTRDAGPHRRRSSRVSSRTACRSRSRRLHCTTGQQRRTGSRSPAGCISAPWPRPSWPGLGLGVLRNAPLGHPDVRHRPTERHRHLRRPGDAQHRGHPGALHATLRPLGDTRGRRPAMVAAGLSGVVAVGLLCLPSGQPLFVASVALIEPADGGISVMRTAVLGDLKGRNTTRNVAWFNMSSDVGAIIGPLAAGTVVDALDFRAAFLLTTLILSVGVVSSPARRETLATLPEGRGRQTPAALLDPRPTLSNPPNPPKGNAMPGPAPVPTPETLPFWEGAARQELRIQRCTSCAEHYFYPRPFCPRCGSAEVEWTTVSGDARLLSYVINHRPLPPFDPATPVVVALVELAEGPHLMTNIVDVAPEPENLELDMKLKVRFLEREGFTLPVFAPAGAVA
nr:MFS transporter [Streptomyces carpinensis]